jgi:hypothetical protein
MRGKSILPSLIVFAIVIASCSLVDIEGLRPKLDIKPDPNKKTTVMFDNTQGVCAVSVYDDYHRRDEDKIAEVPAGQLSQGIEWTPGSSVPFYFSYFVKLKGLSGFTLNYVPEVGKDQIAVRVDANTKTTVAIPKLDETISSPDALLSNNSYLLIQNNSSYPFRLYRGDSDILPDNSSAALVNNGERAQYTINPGVASQYRLLVGAVYTAFSGSLVSFEAGRVYSFVFDGNAVTLTKEVEIKLENVTGIPQDSSVPETPDAPVVTASDGLLTLRWTAVQGAEQYEVYLSTAQQPASTPVRTVPGTTTVLTGLINKTAYYVWIKAVNNSGSSDFSSRGWGIPWPVNEVPAAPERPIIIPGINQLTVNWEECGGASSYEVYISTSTARPSVPEITSGTASAVINNLQNDVIYYVWVRAVNSAGKSNYSPIEAGTPTIPTAAPAAPSKPILAAGNHELTASWQAVELAEFYEVWFSTSDDSALSVKFGGDINGITETVITGLENETVYYIWIRAKNVAGISGFSFSASAKPSAFAVLPETPSSLSVSSGSGLLNVSWPEVEGALSYEVWAGVSNNSASATKHGADISGTSVMLTGLTNETTYYIWIKAKNNIGVSGFSPHSSGTPSAFAVTPAAPQTTPTVISGNAQLTVSWQAVEGASSYEVWAGSNANPTLVTKRGDDVSGLSAVITGLSNGTVYYVWVKAKNNVGTSGFSPAASGTPSVFSVVPQIPVVPSVSLGNEQVTVTWTAVEGATAYEVWMNTVNNSASSSKNGDDISTALSATIDGLINGNTYYIWLKAKNSTGASGFSPAATGKPIANALVPTLSAGNEELSVNWSAIAGADQYEVFCGTGVNPPDTASQTINDPATSATITGLVNGTNYNVWIRGKNVTGTGAMGSPANAKPIGNMGTVSLVSGNEQLTANWSTVAGADEYEVYYGTTNSIPISPAQIVSTTTVTINGLTNGTMYYVWVKGKNADGTSTSIAVSGKPLGTPGVPTLSPDYKKLSVSWASVSGADQYEVYYGIGMPTMLAVTTTETTATISGLTSDTTYYVRLRAKNANGVSDYGSSASSIPGNIRTPGLYRGDEKIGDQNLSTALSWISTNVNDGDDYFVVIGTNESISTTALNYSGRTVNITLQGYDSERSISLNTNGCMFSVNSGVTLTLDEKIVLVGRSTNNTYLVNVDGRLIMNDGAKLTGNKGSLLGGGVYVGSSGTFTINGGKIFGITGSYGGGVNMSGGSFIMNGGEISGNTTGNGGSGGGVDVVRGTFTMTGGEIFGNTATYGGGVSLANNSCFFTMAGGKIFGNTAFSRGGGVQAANFTMTGGEISGNIASERGGGVSVENGTFTMNGGEISGNTNTANPSYGGGGVYISNGTFTKSGGGTITGYASDTVNGNVVKDSSGIVQSNKGHAVAVYAGSSIDKRRETTAGPEVNLDSSVNGAAGGWEN